MAKSVLRQQIETAAPTGNLVWDKLEAALEVIVSTLGGVSLGAPASQANPGSDSTKAIAVQGVTGGKTIPTVATQKQLTGTPSSFAIRTADETVFTLAAGEIGFIQNLSADAPLAVKKGASASTISMSFILAAATAASDGTGGAVKIDDWVGAVSVAKMTGTASYLAWKQAA